ncbi:MAG: hypothetical protein MI808_15020 [Pseudomonadales bacterium]|nr:hypothetical protein [Pseudomonadales bacterium]
MASLTAVILRGAAAAGAFLAAVFLAGAFFAGAFLAAVFLTGAFFFAGMFASFGCHYYLFRYWYLALPFEK